jgi:hypothetical protein
MFGSCSMSSGVGPVITQPGTRSPRQEWIDQPSAQVIAGPVALCRTWPSTRTETGRSAMTHWSSSGHHQPHDLASVAHRSSCQSSSR